MNVSVVMGELTELLTRNGFRDYEMTTLGFSLIVMFYCLLSLITPAAMWLYYYPFSLEIIERHIDLIASMECKNPGQVPYFRISDAVLPYQGSERTHCGL